MPQNIVNKVIDRPTISGHIYPGPPLERTAIENGHLDCALYIYSLLVDNRPPDIKQFVLYMQYIRPAIYTGQLDILKAFLEFYTFDIDLNPTDILYSDISSKPQYWDCVKEFIIRWTNYPNMWIDGMRRTGIMKEMLIKMRELIPPDKLSDLLESL